jgi:hypothetical protein
LSQTNATGKCQDRRIAIELKDYSGLRISSAGSVSSIDFTETPAQNSRARIETGFTMSEPQLSPETAEAPAEFSPVRFLLRELPYLAVLALALFGVAYTSFSGRQLNGFWEFLAIATGVVCVATAWPGAQERETRLKLVGTQAAHWATILVAMNLVLWPSFQQLMPVPATGMVLLMVLFSPASICSRSGSAFSASPWRYPFRG